jgi:hypothetical protein
MWMYWECDKLNNLFDGGNDWHYIDLGAVSMDEAKVKAEEYLKDIGSLVEGEDFLPDGHIDAEYALIDCPPRIVIQEFLDNAQEELKEIKKQIKSLESQLKRAKD